ncbi:MAG: tRNA uridine-5-carboxymethylaminomethyl(34) synthesis GTPase MnmE [Litorimonas sp.]
MSDALPLQDETIFALSSAPGRAGVSVLRLSGLSAARALRVLTGRALPSPRAASLRSILDRDGEIIDKPLVLWFPAPKSFTGEDCAEIHVHGSVAILEAVAARLTELGLRQAKPGEFTRRAVEHGKMDLTEAEGLADLIDARTEGQRVQALSNMGGALRETYEGWQSLILDALAQIEGEIDFADEADVPDALSHAAYPILTQALEGMQVALADAGRGQAIRDGLQVAIIGVPNAGKSTLLNALVGRDVAITSPQAGTTRDIVEAQSVIAGLPVTFSDTAGLRESEDMIEVEGVRRARARAEDAHLVVHVVRGDGAPELASDIVFVNTEDEVFHQTHQGIMGNALSGAGVDLLLSEIERQILVNFSGLENAALTRVRHVDCISSACENLELARGKLGVEPELSSENLRKALKNIEELAGRSDIEQVFDRIFSSFCIGK